MQTTSENLKKIGLGTNDIQDWLTNKPYNTAFLYFDTDKRKGYYEILSCKRRKNPNQKTFSVQIEGQPDDERFVVPETATVYIWTDRGQLIEDKDPDETLCDYAYFGYQDWLAAWQANPCQDFAERVIMWRDRFLDFASQTK